MKINPYIKDKNGFFFEDLYTLVWGTMSFWGELNCPKCSTIILELKNNYYLNLNMVFQDFNFYVISSGILPFYVSNTRAIKRIGPHNQNIISIIFGSLLGDGYAEKHGNGTRICFQQEGSHSSYLLWFHQNIANLGYCKQSIPKFSSRLAKNGKLRTVLRFQTYTFSSFDWIRESFYLEKKKIVPLDLENYLTPLALAIWIQDDGGKVSSGLKLASNCFTKIEVMNLSDILNSKFNLKTGVHSAGNLNKDQYNIYIYKQSISNLTKLVSPYIHPSMKYKLVME